MNQEENHKAIEQNFKDQFTAIWLEGNSMNDLMVCVDNLMEETRAVGKVEIREAQIKILEELKGKTQKAIEILTTEQFFHLRPLNTTRVSALEWQIKEFDNLISELREEGKEKV